MALPATSALEINEPQTLELETSALETKHLNDSPPTI